MNGHIGQRELVNHRLQPGGPPQHRLDQMEVEVGANDREHNSGQSPTGTDIDHRAGSESRCNHRAVEEMPFPEPGHFAWPDQPVTHASVREDLRETLG